MLLISLLLLQAICEMLHESLGNIVFDDKVFVNPQIIN